MADLPDNGTLVLAVDDNADALYTLEKVLEHNGYRVVTAHSGDEAFQKAQLETPSILLCDVVMPQTNGYQTTKRFRADPRLKFVPIILLTAKDSLADIVYGLDQGADDYITKPFQPDELLARLRAALRLYRLYEELRTTQQKNSIFLNQLSSGYHFEDIVGQSPPMQEVFKLLQKVVQSDSGVLITGASGTGKELIAKAIHFKSARCEQPFIAKNCAAFTESLLESELFGHVRGAFTGALKDSGGVFDAANGGTLFLDEVGEMSQTMQAKLLRVLQDGVISPVGTSQTHRVDVRVLAATNRDLSKMIEEGKFREDLYYRLNVININLPALASRREDIPALVNHFLQRAGATRGEQVKRVTPEAMDALMAYGWKGNVRELQNEIERLMILGDDREELGIELLSSRIVEHLTTEEGDRSGATSEDAEGKSSSLKNAVESVERGLITAALEKSGGNKSLAARELGISRSNLIAKVQQFGLERGGKANR